MFHLTEVAATLNIPYNLLYKYIRDKKVLQPEESLAGHRYYTQKNIAKLKEQLLAIETVNKNYFKKYNPKRNRSIY